MDTHSNHPFGCERIEIWLLQCILGIFRGFIRYDSSSDALGWVIISDFKFERTENHNSFTPWYLNVFYQHCYCPQMKLRKGNVFISVCQEFCPEGGFTPPGRPPPRQTATAADGMHPTGMHSCLEFQRLCWYYNVNADKEFVMKSPCCNNLIA